MHKELSTFSVLYRIFARDIKVALRRQSDVAAVFFFFIIAASLFPLGSGCRSKIIERDGAKCVVGDSVVILHVVTLENVCE